MILFTVPYSAALDWQRFRLNDAQLLTEAMQQPFAGEWAVFIASVNGKMEVAQAMRLTGFWIENISRQYPNARLVATVFRTNHPHVLRWAKLHRATVKTRAGHRPRFMWKSRSWHGACLRAFHHSINGGCASLG